MKYAYKPYHPWRHGYRRERIVKWLVRLAKLLLVAEGVVLAGRYIRENTYEKIYEEKVFWEEGQETGNTESDFAGQRHGDSVFGIGFGVEDGSVFWFHKQTEVIDKSEADTKENDEEN